MKRVLSALTLLPPLMLVVWLAPGWAFNMVVAAAVILGLDEVFRMFGIREHPSLYIPAILLGLLISFGASMMEANAFQFVLLAALLLFSFWIMAFRPDLADAARLQMGGFFGLLFVALLLGYLPKLMKLPHGRENITFLLTVIWLGDTASYYVGKNLGKKKLAPSISPGKTVEGCLAGFGGNLLGTVISKAIFLDHIAILNALTAGLLLGLFGQLGDLSESVLKRVAGVKDSGNIIPGHGGVLDRIDSLLFGAPALYYYLLTTMGLGG